MICMSMSVILVCAQLSCIEAPVILSYFPLITQGTWVSCDPPSRGYTFIIVHMLADSSAGSFAGNEADTSGQSSPLVGEWYHNNISFTVFRPSGSVFFRGIIIQGNPHCSRLNLGTLSIGCCPPMP